MRTIKFYVKLFANPNFDLLDVSLLLTLYSFEKKIFSYNKYSNYQNVVYNAQKSCGKIAVI